MLPQIVLIATNLKQDYGLFRSAMNAFPATWLITLPQQALITKPQVFQRTARNATGWMDSHGMPAISFMISSRLRKDTIYRIAQGAIQVLIIPKLHLIVFHVTNRILSPPPIPIISLPGSQQTVLRATPLIRAGARLNSGSMMPNSSPSTVANTRVNGAGAPIAIQIPETLENSVASRVIQTRKPMMITHRYLGIPIATRPAWLAIPLEMQKVHSITITPTFH